MQITLVILRIGNTEILEGKNCTEYEELQKHGIDDWNARLSKRMPQLSIQSGCVVLAWCIIMPRFASSSSNVWLLFQVKNNVRSAPACTALTEVLYQRHNVHTAIVTYAVREKGM